MFSPKKATLVNTSAIAVNAWIQEVEEAHKEIQRELENIRYGGAKEDHSKSVDQMIDSLRRLRAVVPTPRMITAWVGSDAAPRWN